ncbi:thiamine biosynthesis protein ThiS [Thermococcus sp. P6]|uniref:MoaD/ThiS family protein n=1 Tax=Thermococcus sp. P6 TaxID=122420 RepID=UPI000B5A057C|nr:MoaD/ThiS family protein [Thermococcus sp. P6]ASJ10282.1 thiamine biosynthesis protein ThiS [Thermococcus sp. P6]
MKIKVKLYGEAALKHGPEIEIEVKEGTRVSDVLAMLKLSENDHHLLINERKVSKDHPLNDGDVLKVLPVVYGG